MDHINYSRSLSIHLRDMTSPSTLHPSLYTHFSEGRFVAHRTTKSFSVMALDKAHEQLNALVKGEGGAMGLTDNAVALRRWMVAGPELSRMIQEFDLDQSIIRNLIVHRFLSSRMREPNWCYPWSWESLLGRQWWLDHFGHQIYHGAVFYSICENCIYARTGAVRTLCSGTLWRTAEDPLKKNKLPLFSKKKNLTKVDHQVAALKEDRPLFGRLYITSQNRDGDFQNLFKHENQPWPPSLSHYGELRSGTKSDFYNS